jgi:hypothetical protein
MVSSTIKVASLVAAGQVVATGAVSAKVPGLAEGVLRTMLLTKIKIVTAALLAVATLGMGAGWLTHQVLAQRPAHTTHHSALTIHQTEVSGVVKAVDTSRSTVTLHPGKSVHEARTFTVAGDAKVFMDDGTGDKLGFQEGKLADLSEGAPVTLRLSRDQKVVRIWAEGPTIQGTLKSADTGKATITVAVALTKGKPATDKSFVVAKNARLFVDDGQVHDKSKPTKQPSLADLPTNALVFLKLSADRKIVGSIRAEGQTVTGLVKAVDDAKHTITITISIKGEPQVDRLDRTFPVAKAAQVFIDDGKPKDKSKPADMPGIADVPVGAQATLRRSLDGKSVVAIVAEGSSVYGTVKAVDAAKSTLTLHDKIEKVKTYGVTKDAVVFLDDEGEVRKLADVPVGANVNLKLLADQKRVREIRAYGPTVTGSVAGKAGKYSITLHEKEGDKTYAVAKDARVLIDDQTPGKLADLIDGTVAQLRLSADQAKALEVRAEGPSFRGTVKALDPDQHTITLTIGAKNGMGGEDKEFKLTKGTVILTEIYGAALKLTDVRANKEVILRLSIDQKAAARITVLGE